MEFKEHVSIIKKSKNFIIIFTLVITLLGAVVGYFMGVRYKTSISFSIIRTSSKETADYQYDDYYAIRSAELLGQTMLSWFLTPPFLVEIYDGAGLPANITSLDTFGFRFKAKLIGPQNLQVSFTEGDADTAKKLANAIVTIVEKEAAQLDQSQDANTFKVVGSEPVIIESVMPTWLTALVGLFVGLVTGIIMVYLKRYLKEV
ncbi:MAG: hypothetical protein A3F54_04705 [Candidatus Kerfeldbacteria bacterium RIFCSPHIGHO2_12_FULL_48_17]|uniref:Polysaccharide chain length determinant N-terminal domain-containing protein n=1 Tax=Candidatus Kerfeldbacteria bacterium RIFCSPHIGHO2_12_FULL_48_17 TaxID=1798542 RepID=A0A1G2AY24_9BACT|nr:MAG: hypothetical protein A3F54_04705 [Candidatus Kerfeldbacteria bacterium RIFCSPHIGHO2_12_FULL_48_17]